MRDEIKVEPRDERHPQADLQSDGEVDLRKMSARGLLSISMELLTTVG